MRPPRPIVIILVLFALAVINLSQPATRVGAEEAGYLFGAIVIPAILSLLYVRWYRGRKADSAGD
jgi:hypothetical protein